LKFYLLSSLKCYHNIEFSSAVHREYILKLKRPNSAYKKQYFLVNVSIYASHRLLGERPHSLDWPSKIANLLSQSPVL